MSEVAYVDAAMRGYKQVLETQGPAGLAYLNGRVKHRFTAIYQLAHGTLRNTYMHDKQGQVVPDDFKVVPLNDSFCQFVLRDGFFTTHNSAQDERLNGLKFQGVLGAYYGVPLLNNQGTLYGTLCHFDLPNHYLDDLEFAVLRESARLLPAYLFRMQQPQSTAHT